MLFWISIFWRQPSFYVLSVQKEFALGKGYCSPLCVLLEALTLVPYFLQLPQKAVDIVAVRQQLLSQYDILQSRLKELKQYAQKEVNLFSHCGK